MTGQIVSDYNTAQFSASETVNSQWQRLGQPDCNRVRRQGGSGDTYANQSVIRAHPQWGETVSSQWQQIISLENQERPSV